MRARMACAIAAVMSLCALAGPPAMAEPYNLLLVDLVGLAPEETDALMVLAPDTLILPRSPAVKVVGAGELGGMEAGLLRGQGVEAAPLSALCGEPADAPALLSAIDEAWLFADLQAASQALAELETAAVCGGGPLTARDLGMLYFNKGLEAVYGGEAGGADLFHAAMTIWPGLPYPIDANSDVKVEFDDARSRILASPNIRIKVDTARLAGLSLYVDGAPVTGADLLIPGGPHFIQVVDGRRRVLVGSLVSLEPAPNRDAVHWPPPALRPTEAGSLAAALAEETRASVPGPVMTALASELANTSGVPFVVFVGLSQSGALKARWFASNGFVGDKGMARLASPRDETPEGGDGGRGGEVMYDGRSSRLGPSLTIGFSVLAAGSAATYAGLYRRVDTQPFNDPEVADRYVRFGLTAEGVAIGAAVAAGTSLAYTLVQRRRRRGDPWAMRVGVAPTLEAEGPGIAVALSGRLP